MRSLLLCAAVLLTAVWAPDVPAGPRQGWDTNTLLTPGPGTSSTTSTTSTTTSSSSSASSSSTSSAACALKLRPSGRCGGDGGGDGEDCPYQITLPPLTVQLPKQFRLLEKTLTELQSLKETVERLRTGCLECRSGGVRGAGGEGGGGGSGQQQVPIQGDSADATAPELGQTGTGTGQEQRGGGTVTVGGAVTVTTTGPEGSSGRSPVYLLTMQEMQVKMSRMSASLRNARSHISSMEGRLEGLKLLNVDNVRSMVDNRVENITETVNKLKSSCNTYCAASNPPRNILAPRDCSDYNGVMERKNGVYRVMADAREGTFDVYCDLESFGGGWTVIQQRLNGSVSFNRTWAEYKRGFGDLRGEFWIGNDRIHQLTKSKDMLLRIELEDFEGVREYAKYDQFYVANEFLRYRLSVSGYSGTAGNAISFNKHFNHDQKYFTTPDRDNDMYPSGNCGAYYSSGWWFDACMSANLNGKYYHKRYKGVRNGIFWGTWHNQTTEFYPTNYRQAFKSVKMMIRPKNYAP